MEIKNIKDWWKAVTIWEIATLRQWFCLNSKSKHYVSDSSWIPLLKIGDLVNNTETLFVKDSIPKQFLVNENEIIYSRTGQVGLAFIWKKWVIYNNCFKVIPNDGIDYRYLYYYLRSEKIVQQAKWLAWWVAQPDLNHDSFKSIHLIIPESIGTQQIIAWFISNYDNLIENNNRRIQILEQTAQEIYKEWFIDFRFPWYETIKMIDSGTDLWEIPEGWNIENLWDRIKILKWKNITRATIIPWDIPVVAWWISPAYYHNKPNVNWPVITISASWANAGYIRLYYQDIWASDCSYISKDNSKFIYYYYLLLKDKQINITNLQVGSAQPHVYPKDIISFKVIVPNNDIIADFETKITPIFHELSNLENQNNNLIKTRDLLLPKLISWEIDVSELEII